MAHRSRHGPLPRAVRADLARPAAAPRDRDRRRARAGVADRLGNGCGEPIGCRDRGAAPHPGFSAAGGRRRGGARPRTECDGTADRHAARSGARAPASGPRPGRGLADDGCRAGGIRDRDGGGARRDGRPQGSRHDRGVAERLVHHGVGRDAVAGDGRNGRRAGAARSARSSPARHPAPTSDPSRRPACGCTAARPVWSRATSVPRAVRSPRSMWPRRSRARSPRPSKPAEPRHRSATTSKPARPRINGCRGGGCCGSRSRSCTSSSRSWGSSSPISPWAMCTSSTSRGRRGRSRVEPSSASPNRGCIRSSPSCRWCSRTASPGSRGTRSRGRS